MSIIRFVIPSVVSEQFTGNVDSNKLVNAVQAELNAGKVMKTSAKTRPEWKTAKDEDGNERMVIDVTTKSGEKIRCENGIGVRFFAWCNTLLLLQSYGNTDFTIPDMFTKWIAEKFTVKTEEKK